MKKYWMLIAILFMTVGYSAVSTTLTLSSSSSIVLESGFYDKVYFDNVVSAVGTVTLSDDKKIFTYSGIDSVNNFNFDIVNEAKQYGASAVVTCISSNETLSIANNNKSYNIDALSATSGDISFSNNSNEISVICSLEVEPTERTSVEDYKTLLVDFEPNGGSVDTSVKEVVYVQEYGELPVPTREGYTFAGWYTAEENGVLVNSLSSVTNFNDHTLYARWKSTCTLVVGQTWNFDYTGAEQDFTTPCYGIYKVELWGAQGGDLTTRYVGGKGAYTSGNIFLSSNTDFSIYVGEAGNNIRGDVVWNNGSTTDDGRDPVYNEWGASGGGSTDIRLIGGNWDSFDSLKSRLMVAAAGGGAANRGEDFGDGSGGAAGGLNGYDGETVNYSASNNMSYPMYSSYGATQVSGGTIVAEGMFSDGNHPVGLFGKVGFEFKNSDVFKFASSGGNGYYGGGGYQHTGSSGGSSFISGHNGCDAITKASTESNIVHTGQSNHYSGYVFTDTVMIDGAGYNWSNMKESYVGQPQPNNTTAVGHSGNGYARITLIDLNE